jgi:glycosyltransferase 2 family protein
MNVIRRYRTPLAWGVALLALMFLARVLLDSGAELQRYPLTIEPAALALSFVALSVPLLFAVPLWLWGLRWLGASLAPADAARIWFLSNSVRYVPGNIWQPVTMVVLAKERGVDEVRTATSVVLNWILSNLSGLLVAGLYWTVDPAVPSRERLWLLPLVALAALLALHPVVLGRALRLALRATGRPAADTALGYGRLIWLLLLHCAVWVGYGVAFAVFWSALFPLDWRELPRLTGVFAGAYAIGFLSLLTPSGLGVREGALVFFLSGVYPVAVVTVVALLSRVWLIAGELLCTGLVLLFTRGRHA